MRVRVDGGTLRTDVRDGAFSLEVELAVARAVARGLTNAEIYVSSGTVKADVSALLTRLGLANRTQLAITAHSLPPEPAAGARS